MTQTEGQPRKQRVKKYHIKTSTGCMTCRRRRVKCDEGKPACARCHRFGVQCEWSGRNRSMTTTPVAKDAGPTHPFCSTISSSLSGTYGTPEQAAYLDFYLRCTAPMISMASPAKDIWTITMPRTSWHFLPIKHMICALAMLDQDFDAAATPHAATIGHAKALKEYNRGISAFRLMKAPNLSGAVLFSVMAWCFNSIITKYDEATLHEQAMQSMVAYSRTPGTRLSVQDQVVIEQTERMFKQCDVASGQWSQYQPGLEHGFTDLQESWRELYYVLERAASDIDEIVTSGWGPILRSLESWRTAFELYRFFGSGSLQQKKAIVLAQNMVVTYLVSMDPQSMQASWERKHECELILTDMEKIVSTYNNLDDIRWISNCMLLNIADIAEESEGIISRVRRIEGILEKSTFKPREINHELNFIVSIESTMPAKHAVLRKARALWIEQNS